MIQEILTYIIVASAVLIASYKVYKAIPFRTTKTSQAQGKCGSCATGCSLKDLKGNPECPPENQFKILKNSY